jgi:glutathione S-transferase
LRWAALMLEVSRAHDTVRFEPVEARRPTRNNVVRQNGYVKCPENQMLRLYGDQFSGNCYKAKLALAQLQIPHEWVPIDILNGQSRTPAFMAMNPSGQVPVLELSPGSYLAESNAILHYLAAGSALLPADRLTHAQVLRWMFWEQYSHEPNVASARFIVRYLGRPPQHEEILARRIADGNEALSLMEQHLSTHPFFVARTYTIADIALFAYTHVAHEGGFDLESYPNILAWIARVQEQPGHVAMGA